MLRELFWWAIPDIILLATTCVGQLYPSCCLGIKILMLRISLPFWKKTYDAHTMINAVQVLNKRTQFSSLLEQRFGQHLQRSRCESVTYIQLQLFLSREWWNLTNLALVAQNSFEEHWIDWRARIGRSFYMDFPI